MAVELMRAVTTRHDLRPGDIGRLVTLLTEHSPDTLLQQAWPTLVVMAAVLLLLRPAAVLARGPGTCRLLYATDGVELIRALEHPVLVVSGTEDVVTPPEKNARLQKELAGG